jgi:hypothetical protein
MIKKILPLIFITSLLYACGSAEPAEPTVDVNAIHTAAAQTVMAEFTQTAKAIPPTPEATATEAFTATPETPLPTETPTVPVDAFGATLTPIPCDDSNYSPSTVDVTYPDDSEVAPAQDFVKTWKIKNTGTCVWGTGYSIIFAFGEKMSGVAEPLPAAVAPGEEVEISVRFQAPANAGQYSSTWRMANANNSPFGETFYVRIVVR